MLLSSNAKAPLVAIIGITGNQGGSVARNLVESDKEYRLRGLTRKTTGAAAQKLQKEGIELVEVDITPENGDKLVEAFKGADYVFAVTNFWQSCDINVEVAQGKAIVDAVKKAAGPMLIWSGLDSYAKASNGKYPNVDHYEGKYQITQYAKQSGVPLIVVQAGCYADNLQKTIQKQEDGALVFPSGWPANTKLPIVAIEDDYGLYVRAAIEGGYKSGDELFSTSEDTEIGNAIKDISEVIGKPIKFMSLSDKDFKAGIAQMFPAPRIQQEYFEMVAHHREFGYYESGFKGTRASQEKLARKPLTIKQWAEKQDWSQFLN